MFKRILVGVDGHDGGRDAIALATILREPDSIMLLAHVFMAHIDARLPDYERLQRDAALRLLTEARAGAGLDAELRTISTTSPPRGLHWIANEEGADLLVVGASRRGAIERIVTGDDTRGVVKGARCAIAIAPEGYAARASALHTLGVGYDGSDADRSVVRFATELAGELGARMSAFTAVTTPTDPWGPGPLPLSDTIQASIQHALDNLAAQGVEGLARYGPAVELLTEYSAGLDLLIIGCREEGPIGQLVHGSTAQELARTAGCPLLVLPRKNGVTAAEAESRAAAGHRRH